jgi:SAM-dependent methyltransferase
MDNPQLVRRFYPESNVGGFSHVDGTVTFFTQIAAILRATDRVLDFGAGRGEPLHDDPVDFRRELGNLKGRCAHLEGCDIDEAVLDNPFLDHAEVFKAGAPLPYDDEAFDIVIARSVFEHIEDAEWLGRELLRVTKPGGLIAAVTPNQYGYIALAAGLVPNSMHVATLRSVQPGRKAEDVFPTYYRLNTPKALKRVFGSGADVYAVRGASEPGYHFGSPLVFRVVRWINKHVPSALQPTLYVYIRKR